MTAPLPADTSQYIAMLRISPAQFRYACYHPAVDGSMVCDCEPLQPGEPLVPQIEHLLYAHEQLLQTFKKLYVVLPTQQFMLVPVDVTADTHAQVLYERVYPIPAESRLLQCHLPHVGAHLLFPADSHLVSFLQRTLCAPVVLHPLAPLCEYFYRKSRVGNHAKVYAQLYGGHMEVVCFDKRGLLLANTFVTPTIDDAAYYILHLWQQLGLDQQADEVHIAGDSASRRDLATILRRFILTVVPVIFPAQRHVLGSDAMQLPFDLTALSLCEL